MANHKSCEKKMRVNERRHFENLKAINLCKSNIKELKAEKDKIKAQELLKIIYKQLDKLSCKHRIHKNTGARLKSKFTHIVNALK